MGSIFEKEVDILFMDPPYDCGHEKNVLSVLQGMRYVTENTLIIVEASLHSDFSWLSDLGFHAEKEKCYKTNKHVFIRKTAV